MLSVTATLQLAQILIFFGLPRPPLLLAAAQNRSRLARSHWVEASS